MLLYKKNHVIATANSKWMCFHSAGRLEGPQLMRQISIHQTMN